MVAEVITLNSIGLKQAYRKNMAIGFGISASLHLLSGEISSHFLLALIFIKS